MQLLGRLDIRFRWSVMLVLLLVQSDSHGLQGAAAEQVRERLAGLRIPFIANVGQGDPAVAYYAPTFAGVVFVTRDGQIVYSLPGEKSSARVEGSSSREQRRGGWSLTETAVGGTGRPSGSNRAPTRVSYFLGSDPARWTSGLGTFEGVSLGEVWPGISLDLRAHGKSVEKVFTVEPGGDPSRIRMSVAGARSLRTDRAGALIASTGLGDVTFTAPAAYQESQGARHSVRVAYEVSGQQYGFRLDGYDSTLPVVIDPLLQSTYLGGSSFDEVRTLAIHPASGDVYVAGQTFHADFPGTAGGAQPAFGGSSDAYVARLNAALTTLRQATYLGGSDDDGALAIAIHPTSGEVYVGGVTASTDFPGTQGGAQPTSGGGGDFDGFVVRLNAGLSMINQATYLGGRLTAGLFADDLITALAIHPTSGDVYVAGSTACTDFPGTTGGAQPAISGVSGAADAFVAHLSATLTTLHQATYLGGSDNDFAATLAVHPVSGEVYVAGYTASIDFPGTTGGAQSANAGGGDVFVARLNAGLATLNQATYLGGSDDDSFFGRFQSLAVHPTSGDVYVAGVTLSADFPGTAGGAQPELGGSYDGYVARMNAALTTLDRATYLGGSSFEFASALAIHPTSGEVYVAGYSGSTNFPGTAGGAQAAKAGGTDAVVARLNASLTTINQATYLGGNKFDFAYALAIHPVSHDVYVAGYTLSTDFLGATGGAQATSGGDYDGFIARLTADLAAGELTALSPAKVWVGLKNSDDVGLRLDLLAEVFVDTKKVGQGQVNNVSSGGSGFNNAIQSSITLNLTGGSVSLDASNALKLKISARRTCFGAGHATGTARLWYNGQPVDSGASRDAGTRFDATIIGSTRNYFARNGFALNKVAGSSKLSIDASVNSRAACPNRPFTEFGTWSIASP